MTKAITSFTHYRDADLCPVARAIHKEMSKHADVFTEPAVRMAELLAQCVDYEKKLAARADRGLPNTLAFNVARLALEVMLKVQGNYVNITAKGDPVIVELSGYPSYVRRYSANYAPPPAPVNMRVNQGPVSGSFLLRFKAGRRPSMNEVAVNTTDPTNEADWRSYGSFSGGRVELSGFTPGELVWVRARTMGL